MNSRKPSRLSDPREARNPVLCGPGKAQSLFGWRTSKLTPGLACHCTGTASATPKVSRFWPPRPDVPTPCRRAPARQGTPLALRSPEELLVARHSGWLSTWMFCGRAWLHIGPCGCFVARVVSFPCCFFWRGLLCLGYGSGFIRQSGGTEPPSPPQKQPHSRCPDSATLKVSRPRPPSRTPCRRASAWYTWGLALRTLETVYIYGLATF